ncbi:MAG TPA: ABC transporter substrate-binding protein, partial [Gemmatimonadaceae bacterium]
EVALERAKALRARGVRILIGPQSSAEVARLTSFVDRNDLLLVSHASTAGTLAITGDNIFRFSPTDDLEGAAISALMWEDGIRAVIPLWRDDVGNAGLEAAVRTRFSGRGGTVLDGVQYGVSTRDFAGTVSAVRTQLDQAIAKFGPGRVAIYLAGFDEVSQIFTRSAADPVLGSVRWFGGDGVALSSGIIGDQLVAQFAARTGFAAALFGLDEGARDIWEPLHARIRARVNHEPDAFAYAAYDAVWAVARGYIASGATLNREKLKRAFTTAAASGYGATGWTVLNDAGDRRYGDFDFWVVKMEQGQPRWTRMARYESRTRRLTR